MSATQILGGAMLLCVLFALLAGRASQIGWKDALTGFACFAVTTSFICFGLYFLFGGKV